MFCQELAAQLARDVLPARDGPRATRLTVAIGAPERARELSSAGACPAPAPAADPQHRAVARAARASGGRSFVPHATVMKTSKWRGRARDRPKIARPARLEHARAGAPRHARPPAWTALPAL